MSNKTLVAFRTWRDISLVITAAHSIIQSGHSEEDLLFIDDASDGGQFLILKSVFPQASIKVARKRLEYCRCFNYAARFAKRRGYRNLLILNNDTKGYSNNYVDRLESAIDLKRGVFLAGSMVKDFEGGWIHNEVKFKLGIEMKIPTEGYIFDVKTFLALGGFNKSLYRYLEDIDLVHRSKLAGFNSTIVYEAYFEHLGNGSSRVQLFVPYYYRLRNLIWFLKKYQTLSLAPALKIIFRWTLSSFHRAWEYRDNGCIFLVSSVGSIVLGIFSGLFFNGIENE